jgi:hypothetical protein
LFGATALIRWYPEPSEARGSGSPLLGQNDIARSASPVINQRGIHTRIGGHHTTVDDVQARVAECPVVGIDNPLVGAFADRDPADEMC